MFFKFFTILAIILSSVGWSFDGGWDPGMIPSGKVSVITDDFTTNLSSADDTVQKALDTLDDLIAGGSINWGDIGGLQTDVNVGGFTNDVGYLTADTGWSIATDQTLLTGDKSGSFDITTTGVAKLGDAGGGEYALTTGSVGISFTGIGHGILDAGDLFLRDNEGTMWFGNSTAPPNTTPYWYIKHDLPNLSIMSNNVAATTIELGDAVDITVANGNITTTGIVTVGGLNPALGTGLLTHTTTTGVLGIDTNTYITSSYHTAGTGISINGTGTITNSLPDQTVSLANGTGISVTGTYPSFTVTNTSPAGATPTLDQVLTAGASSAQAVSIGTTTVTGNLYASGNVGIGTTVPADVLHVKGGATGGVSIDDTPAQTAGNDSDTLLLAHMNGSDDGTVFTDSSSYARTATLIGSPVTKTAVKQFGTASGYSTGSGYISFPDSDDWPSGTSAWTVDCWVNPSDKVNKYLSPYTQRQDANNIFQLRWRNDTQKWEISATNGGAQVVYITTTNTWNPTNGVWYHIAFVRVNSDNAATAWRIYINGVAQALTLSGGAWNGSIPNYSSAPVYIMSWVGAVSVITNYTDEVRVSNIARWTSDFSATLPTAEYGVLSDGSPYLKFKKSGTAQWTIGSDGNDGDKFKIGTTGLTTGTALTVSGANIGVGTTAPLSTLEVVGIGTTSATSSLNIMKSSRGNILFARDDGNVGIGTTAPLSKLEVIGIGTTSASNALQIKDSAGSAKVTFRDDGNVGIGTTAPAQALDVVGSIKSSASILSTATTNIGWSVVTGADTACNTTCTNACVFGQDTAALSYAIVDCADASADRCLCAGSN